MSVTLHTTLGDIKIEVFCDVTPRAAENFLGHCAAGTYNDVKWHRNIKSFMIQTGDPTGTGKGGQSIWGKPFADEIRSTLKFDRRGIVACANAGPDTNKAQFFITYGKQPHLDGKYTIIGKVIDGAEDGGTLDAMEVVPVDAKNRPTSEIRMTGVTVHANPIAMKAIGK
ncbi:probable peptidylprolyl isomerase (cyclophilin)-like protein [Ustilago trichophora]|uniref:Peptidyl-prolyl cis-trans isomerase n=1 Tax=Ustilago trichophora TaxID=86804 RepID=A0A5C3E9M8_9BASI|nr:probable peptidylprolyl isomerase (cyclophilin)-like protein [Ustilago trichophora]